MDATTQPVHTEEIAMYVTTLIQAIMSTVEARENCRKAGNHEWLAQHGATLRQLFTLLPSGSGIDNGTKVEDCDAKRLKLLVEFHHMNDVGMYDGWTSHMVRVTPGWRGPEIRVSGPDRNSVLDDIHQRFDACLTHPVQYDEPSGEYRFTADNA